MVNQCIIINIHQQSFFEPWQYCDTFIEKKNTIPDATPTKKIVINLEEADEINENTAINVQPLPSQDRWKATTAAIFRKYLKEFKDLSYLVENLGDALGYLTNIIQSLRKRQQEVFKFSSEK